MTNPTDPLRPSADAAEGREARPFWGAPLTLDPSRPTGEGGGLSAEEAALRDRVKALGWSAHQIQLTPNVCTLPGSGYDEMVRKDARVALARRVLRDTFGRTDLTGLRIADLGCLEGGLALALALEGAEVLGVEGRESNVRKCELIREHFDLKNLSFVQDDVKNFTVERYGQFDAVMVFGLLYHLDTPIEWLHTISPCVKTLLLVDTEYAPETPGGLDRVEPVTTFSRIENPLAEQLETRVHLGVEYQGRRWFEYPPDTPPELVEAKYWSAVSNSESFWLTRPSIYRLLSECGYNAVGERLDFMWNTDDAAVYITAATRSVFLGVRTGGSTTSRLGPVALPTARYLARRVRHEWITKGPGAIARAAKRKLFRR